jgi:hypothetical protein
MPYIFDEQSKTYIPDTTKDVRAEIGDSKETEFRPRVKLSRWDNEANFSLGLAHDEAELSRVNVVQDKEKIIWAVDNKEAHFYEKPDDAFEFEVLLKEPPKSNVLNFTLNVPKSVKFYYQPPLDEEMKDAELGGTQVPCRPRGRLLFWGRAVKPEGNTHCRIL